MAEAGDLRHQVAIQQATNTPNTFGESVPAWYTIQTLRADVESMGSTKEVSAGGTVAIGTWRVRHRYFASLDETMQYVWQGIVLAINSIEADPRKIQQEVVCLSRQGVTPPSPPPPPPPAGAANYWGSGFWDQ